MRVSRTNTIQGLKVLTTKVDEIARVQNLSKSLERKI